MILELEEHVEAALKGTRKFYVPIFGYINFKAKALMEKKVLGNATEYVVGFRIIVAAKEYKSEKRKST